MKKSIITGFVFLTSVAIMAYTLIKYNATDPGPAIVIGLCVNVISSPLYIGLIELLYNLRNLRLFWKTQIQFRYADVRLSISYLFRIKVDGKYLLVKNRRNESFQLVGGAYKTLPGSEKIFKELKVNPDRLVETSHGIAKNDLRFRLPGRNVFKIIAWFNSREDRETSQWREFCEELLSENILDKYLFRYIDYRYVTTIQTPIQKAKNLPCQEIIIYEIFDLVPNTEQEHFMRSLLTAGDTNKFKWADEDTIRALGFDTKSKEVPYSIGIHTKWAIDEEYSE